MAAKQQEQDLAVKEGPFAAAPSLLVHGDAMASGFQKLGPGWEDSHERNTISRRGVPMELVEKFMAWSLCFDTATAGCTPCRLAVPHRILIPTGCRAGSGVARGWISVTKIFKRQSTLASESRQNWRVVCGAADEKACRKSRCEALASHCQWQRGGDAGTSRPAAADAGNSCTGNAVEQDYGGRTGQIRRPGGCRSRRHAPFRLKRLAAEKVLAGSRETERLGVAVGVANTRAMCLSLTAKTSNHWLVCLCRKGKDV
ncbi:hypothetical protein FH972_022952 [Carpinus fangiana]|uniref:Uncharacterized protein n=1 Tax=Carpinus fangiana TaxID=176857 RepID=A0A5N6KU86_9ROSI|nr:hypothetical protein FH972_022952 [Carpinus fangiana]